MENRNPVSLKFVWGKGPDCEKKKIYVENIMQASFQAVAIIPIKNSATQTSPTLGTASKTQWCP